MQSTQLSRVAALMVYWVIPSILGWILFLPVGLEIQYAVPDDGGAEYMVLAGSMPLLGLAIGFAMSDSSYQRVMLSTLVLVAGIPWLYSLSVDAVTFYPIIYSSPSNVLGFLLPRLMLAGINLSLAAMVAGPLILFGPPDWSWLKWVIRPGFSFVLTWHICLAGSVVLPEVSRSIGPWATIRAAMYEDAERFQMTAQRLGIDLSQEIDHAEWKRIVANFEVRRIRWPGREEEVSLRPLSYGFPYVGIDYGGGRNCTFELPSMRSDFCD